MSDKSTVAAAPILGGKVIKQPNKLIKVKNKTAADVQITAEQLLREAKERQLEIVPAPPKQKIQDQAELLEYQRRKRKEFEDQLRKNRTFIGNWMKYAAWEEKQKQLERTRSIFERALDVDHRNVTLWIKYAEMEMRNKQVNHARNLWDRAVTILPRVNQFWYKYTYMEEMLENVAGCRRIFERWLEWEPEEQAWLTYINFELRYKELDRARAIYERFIYVHPEIKNWTRFAKFEERNNFIQSARSVYERAVEFFGTEHADEHLFIAFARFEEGQKEIERARTIYIYALDTLSSDKTAALQKAYTILEKKHGQRSGIETVISEKRKAKYEAEIEDDPTNYDAWFDLVRLVTTQVVENESRQDFDKVREVYERAIANVPPSGTSKQYWRRYIYLWIQYAVFEELQTKDFERARQVYKTCLEIVSHQSFTFAKVWLLYAYFEVRRHDVTTARKALGTAIGKWPKARLFRGYIELEIKLREFERCRKLYEKYILFQPANATAWIKFAELEALLGDWQRARAVYELAIGQPMMDMPELVWKAYIDFEVEQEDRDGEEDESNADIGLRVRQLYRRLLSKTSHVKVWLAFAQFEASLAEKFADDAKLKSVAITQARNVYREANDSLRRTMVETSGQLDLIQREEKEFDSSVFDDAFAADECKTRISERLTEAEGRLAQSKEHRIAFMDKWLAFERSQLDESQDTSDEMNAVLRLMPTRLKKRRQVRSVGSTGGLWEEYFDYLFPEDEGAKPNLKLLAMAKQWQMKEKTDVESSTGESSSDGSSDESDADSGDRDADSGDRDAHDPTMREESSGTDDE